MNDAFIYDHVRTPRGRGRSDGALHEITPIHLTTQTLAALRDRSELDTTLVEDVMLGCVMPIGEQGCNIARVAALQAGYAESVAGFQLNRFCASGLEAVNLAAARVMSGELDAAIGGGVECMSRVAIASDGGACYSDPQTNWQTWYIPQGIGADMIATLDGYSRNDVDSYAMQSQHRAGRAAAAGHFVRSLTSVRDIQGEVVLSQDEAIRPATSMADLAKLKPAFAALGEQAGFDGVMLQRYTQTERIEHIHTGGNSSSIVDGAAAVLVGNRSFGERSGLKPRARIRAFVSLGSEPAIMLTGPAAATRKALKKAGMTLADIDLFEVNEAFASVVMRFMNELNVPHDKVNVNGGAIAMGHPLGATGAMLLGTVLDELERRNLRTGLITLCAAAGMATATIIERV
ncbi:acetyl-CoA acetyltransferase [Pseudomonas poae]|uniref:Acetyl-CoA acetyltransferase n=1 Tax=Pseudomonas poae TaxID=200451 RepID=A0A423ERJ7_9PSED|nr:acetyl-CoA C-acetyltransferase [Pseudomonas poae]ROM33944.1 acetyl-CoA acetyltransferase [Pseudomonas poae]